MVTSLSLITPAVAESNFAEGISIFGGTVQSSDPSLPNFVPDPEDENYKVTPLGTEGVTLRSAYGAQPIGGFTIKDIRIPSMILEHQINGNGTTIDSEWAEAEGANLCNFRFDFQNRYGEIIYRTDVGNWGCKRLATGAVYSMFRSATRGHQCARMYLSGQFAGEQCHSIH